MDRPAKLARLEEFRRNKPACSASAMAHILKDVAKHGLPPLLNRDNMREARNSIMDRDTAYGKLIQHITVIDKSDAPRDIFIADPFATLWLFCKEGSPSEGNTGFRNFFKQRLLEKPPTFDDPWNLILYTDEVTPGNVLSVMNNRKFHAIYWTFMEFGSNGLAREDAWFVILVEFSSCVNKIHAGISQVIKQCIKKFFQPAGYNLATNGVLLEFPDGDVRLWARLGGILQDGGAHKFVWHVRGDGASKYCVLCRNLFSEESKVVEEDGTNLLRCNVIKLDELVPMNGEDLRKNARYLAGQVGLPEGKFTELQQAIGLTYHPHALLLDRELDDVFDPCDVYQHDTMHGLYVDGVVNLVVYLLFETFIARGLRNVYQVFSEYCSRWKWPARVHGAHLAETFSADRGEKHRAAKHIKCQASDMLSVMGVLVHFTKTVLMTMPGDDRDSNNACQAFLALAIVCELIAETARTALDPAQLLGSVHRFLSLFVNAWGFEWLTPKCHWMLHYADVLMKNGRLFNCFCLERKHRVPKRYAEDIKNISRHASKSILGEVMCQQLANIKNPGAFDFHVGLVGGRPASKAVRKQILRIAAIEDQGDDIKIAQVSRINEFETCHKGDVVLLKNEDTVRAGKVALHLDLAGKALSLVHPWTLHRRVADTAMIIWSTCAEAELWETQDILAAVEYCSFPDDKVGTLLPKRYRA